MGVIGNLMTCVSEGVPPCGRRWAPRATTTSIPPYPPLRSTSSCIFHRQWFSTLGKTRHILCKWAISLAFMQQSRIVAISCNTKIGTDAAEKPIRPIFLLRHFCIFCQNVIMRARSISALPVFHHLHARQNKTKPAKTKLKARQDNCPTVQTTQGRTKPL